MVRSTRGHRRLAGVVASMSFVVVLAGCGNDDVENASGLPFDRMTFIVPFSPGGGTDTVARTFGKYFAEELDVPIVFENVDGAGSTVGTGRLFSSPADGSVVGLTTDVGLQLAPSLIEDLQYEGASDFSVIAKLPSNPMMMVARKDFPADDLAGVFEAAREAPGEISIAHAGPQTSDVVAGLAAAQAAGVKFNHIPFDGGAAASTEVVGGRVDLAIASPATFAGNIEADDLKPIAIFWTERVPQLPDVPTAEEQGFEGMVYAGSYYLMSPKGVPEDILDRLEEAAMDAGQNPAFQDAARAQGSVPEVSSADDANAALTQSQTLLTGLAPEFEAMMGG